MMLKVDGSIVIYNNVKLYDMDNDILNVSPFIPYMRRYSQPNTIIDTIPGKPEERIAKIEEIFGLYKSALAIMIDIGCIVRPVATTYSTGCFPGPLYHTSIHMDGNITMLNELSNIMIRMVDWMILNRQKLI